MIENSDFQKENKIIDALIEQGKVSETQIEKIKENLSNKNKVQLVFEKYILFDPENLDVSFLDSSNKLINKIDLGIKKISNKVSFPDWGDSIAIFNDEHEKVGSNNWNSSDQIGFGILNNKAYLYFESLNNQKFLAQSNSFISGNKASSKVDSFPFDLFLSNNNKVLCLVDRSSGTIYIIDTEDYKLLNKQVIRSLFNEKTINITISDNLGKVFITDNVSVNLLTIDLTTFELSTKNLAIGVLGNIILSPDEKDIYCLVTKPKPVLKLLKLSDFSFKKDFQLKGDLFSLVDSPIDLLSLTTDKQFIYLMTYIIDSDNPRKPVITVISIEKQKPVKRFSIKDNTKPINLAFALENKGFSEDKSLLETLIDQGSVSKEELEVINNELNNLDKSLIEIESKPLEIETTSISELKRDNEKKQKEEDDTWKIKDKPQKIEFCNISPRIDSVLYEICKKNILKDYKLFLDKLSLIEKWDDPEKVIQKKFLEAGDILGNYESMNSIRLKDSIEKARKELEWHDISIIKLSDLLNGFNFEHLFERDQALELVRQQERDELIESGLKTIPSNCPNCENLLHGSYTCRVCGFQLERPEDKLKSKLLKISTYGPIDNIKTAHLLLVDIVNSKLIEIDNLKHIVWEIKKETLEKTANTELIMPTDAVRLTNNITLICDYEANRVYKITQRGKIYWEMIYDFSARHAIKRPISVAGLESGNIIVVDQGNHRVFEIDEDHEIVWQYGERGIEGVGDNFLNTPSYFQRTGGGTNIITDTMNHRIIELENNKVIWQYGNSENLEDESVSGYGFNQLCEPLMAVRYGDENLLILDNGNQRVIEVNRDKEITWSIQLNELEEEYLVDNPYKIYFNHIGNLIVIGDNKIIEVSRKNNSVVWVSYLDELIQLQANTEIKTVKENIKKTKVRHGVSNLYVKKVKGISETELQKKNRLKAIIEGKRAELASRGNIARIPNVVLTKGAEVSDIEILSVDKSKSYIYKTDRQGNTVWVYGDKGELIKPSYAKETKNSIFIADTGNKRILEIDKSNFSILWSYGEADGDEILDNIRSVQPTGNSVLISDKSGVIEILKETGDVIWEYKGKDKITAAYHSNRLKNGNYLLVDWSSHVVLEVSEDEEVVWRYGMSKEPGSELGYLSYPEYAKRLENGNTMIVDTRNNRVIEVTKAREIVWEYKGDNRNRIMSPVFAKRLKNGNTLVYHSNYKQIYEVDSGNNLLWKYKHQGLRN